MKEINQASEDLRQSDIGLAEGRYCDPLIKCFPSEHPPHAVCGNESITQPQKVRKRQEKCQFVRGNQGHWNESEHDTYLQFLNLHKEEMIRNQQNKKNNKIFKLMATTIGTRSPSQCRQPHLSRQNFFLDLITKNSIPLLPKGKEEPTSLENDNMCQERAKECADSQCSVSRSGFRKSLCLGRAIRGELYFKAFKVLYFRQIASKAVWVWVVKASWRTCRRCMQVRSTCRWVTWSLRARRSTRTKTSQKNYLTIVISNNEGNNYQKTVDRKLMYLSLNQGSTHVTFIFCQYYYKMRSLLLVLLVLLPLSQPCTVPVVCQDIQSEEQCDSQAIGPVACEWKESFCSEKSVVSKESSLGCTNATNEYDCNFGSHQECLWTGTTSTFEEEESYESYVSKQKQNTEGACSLRNCASAKERKQCRRTNGLSCDWIGGKCQEFTSCKQAQTNTGCMINYLVHRCISFKDGKPYYGEKSVWDHLSDSEPAIECETYTCKHIDLQYQECPTFVNGFLCFLHDTHGCRTCSDFDTKCSCIGTNECTWQEDKCREIQCEDLKNSYMCTTRSKYCTWNEGSMTCTIQAREDSHCFPEQYDHSIILIALNLLLLFLVQF